MTPQLTVQVQNILDLQKTPANKQLADAFEVVAVLLNQDIFVAKHVLNHLVDLLKK